MTTENLIIDPSLLLVAGSVLLQTTPIADMDIVTLLIDKSISLGVLAWFVNTLNKSLKSMNAQRQKEQDTYRQVTEKKEATHREDLEKLRANYNKYIDKMFGIMEKQEEKLEKLEEMHTERFDTLLNKYVNNGN